MMNLMRRLSQIAAPVFCLAITITLLPSCDNFSPATPTPKIPRIGYLDVGSSGPLYDSFRQGLRDLGYVEGKNIIIEYRSALSRVTSGTKQSNEVQVANELASLNVDLIVAGNDSAAFETSKATRHIPVVMTRYDDPVADGLVQSLAHPGGNFTGLTTISPVLIGKRLELLKDATAGVERVGMIWCPGSRSSLADEARETANALNLELVSFHFPGPEFTTKLTREYIDAIIVLDCSVFNDSPAEFMRLFGKGRLPTMYSSKEFVAAGGLMSYGVNLPDLYRRAATYVDKILKGAKPADLPIEQPTKFEFVINMKTAKEIGLTIPQSVLAQATEVIQ